MNENNNHETKWPSSEDKLFNISDSFNTAEIQLDWHRYIKGYKEAADIIIQKLLDNGCSRSKCNLLIPAIFMYRQCLELQIKLVTQTCHQILGDSLNFKKKHDLSNLWLDCRKVLERIDTPPEINDLDNVERLIIELSDYDKGMAFRYPENVDGSNSIDTETLPGIDIVNFGNVVNGLYSFFDAILYIVDNQKYIEMNWKIRLEDNNYLHY